MEELLERGQTRLDHSPLKEIIIRHNASSLSHMKLTISFTRGLTITHKNVLLGIGDGKPARKLKNSNFIIDSFQMIFNFIIRNLILNYPFLPVLI